MMKDVVQSACSECGGHVRPRTSTQEFEREGMRVSVAGIRTLVCTKCEAVYFAPGGAQALVEAVNSLFAFAKQNQPVDLPIKRMRDSVKSVAGPTYTS